MNRSDVTLAVLIALAVLGVAALFLGTVSAGANATVFNVTDPDRGLYNLHPELVKEVQP